MPDYASYTWAIEDNASAEDVKAIWDGLAEYNRAFVREDYEVLRVFLRDGEGKLAGGILGETYWGWLHIDIFWLSEDARRKGMGTKLLAMAEEEGRRRGCQQAFLDTLSFQARPFYERNGYEHFATQHDYPVGHQR